MIYYKYHEYFTLKGAPDTIPVSHLNLVKIEVSSISYSAAIIKKIICIYI